jgi:hypothetical protein
MSRPEDSIHHGHWSKYIDPTSQQYLAVLGFTWDKLECMIIMSNNNVVLKFMKCLSVVFDCLCGLVVRVPGYRSGCPTFDSRRYQIFWEVVCLERDPLSLECNWGGTCSGSGSRKSRLTAVGFCCADHVTPYIRKSLRQLRRQAAVARSV